MLNENFFKIITITSDSESIEAKIKIDASHEIFSGHFPENPITPGVVQLQIVKEIFELVTGDKKTLKEVGRCKFLAILDPRKDPEVTIKINYQLVENIYKISTQGLSLDTSQTFFKFTAKYA